jgi:hypothetical protein
MYVCRRIMIHYITYLLALWEYMIHKREPDLGYTLMRMIG